MHQAHKFCDECLIAKYLAEEKPLENQFCAALHCRKIIDQDDLIHLVELKQKKIQESQQAEPTKRRNVASEIGKSDNPSSDMSATLEQDSFAANDEKKISSKKSGNFFVRGEKLVKAHGANMEQKFEYEDGLNLFPPPPGASKGSDKKLSVLKPEESDSSQVEEQKSNKLILASNSNILSSSDSVKKSSSKSVPGGLDGKQNSYFKCKSGHWLETCDYEEQYTYCSQCGVHVCRLCRTIWEAKEHKNDHCKKAREEVSKIFKCKM